MAPSKDHGESHQPASGAAALKGSAMSSSPNELAPSADGEGLQASSVAMQAAGRGAPRGRVRPERLQPEWVLACEALLDLEVQTLTMEIVLRALEGDANAEIARSLGVSPSTVRNHLAKVAKNPASCLINSRRAA